MLRVRIDAHVPSWSVPVSSGAGRLRARRLALVVPPKSHLDSMFELRFSGTGLETERRAPRLLVRAPGLRGRRGHIRGSPARANQGGRNERGHLGRRRMRRWDIPGPRVKRDAIRPRAFHRERAIRKGARPADRAAGRHGLVVRTAGTGRRPLAFRRGRAPAPSTGVPAKSARAPAAGWTIGDLHRERRIKLGWAVEHALVVPRMGRSPLLLQCGGPFFAPRRPEHDGRIHRRASLHDRPALAPLARSGCVPADRLPPSRTSVHRRGVPSRRLVSTWARSHVGRRPTSFLSVPRTAVVSRRRMSAEVSERGNGRRSGNDRGPGQDSSTC